MMEFTVFFVLPFDETVPQGSGDEAIERVKAIKNEAEEKCLAAYKAILPEEKKNSHKAWAQSRIDLETRVIGVSLCLPIEKGADHHLVAAVTQDDYLYWDFKELIGAMTAMEEAVSKVAAEYGATAHAAFNDVKYHF
ncbi:MAG: hypothetical protein IJ111_03580 [Eggerthellaceae bacterium]|nr:hypothetical protein [Eggerthellaceae bacterium]